MAILTTQRTLFRTLFRALFRTLFKTTPSKTPSIAVVALALSLALSLAPAFSSLLAQGVKDTERIDRSLTDIRVAYFFEDPELIDWAAIALLSERYGCQVVLVRARGSERVVSRRKVDDLSEISFVDVSLPQSAINSLDSLITGAPFPPDIVIFGAGLEEDITKSIKQRYLSDSTNTSGVSGNHVSQLLAVRKVYRALPDGGGAVVHGAIVNQRELLRQYGELFRRLSAKFFPGKSINNTPDESELFSRYELLRYAITSSFRESDFLSGVKPLRLEELINAVIPESAARGSHLTLARQFQRDFDAARSASSARKRVDLLVSGYRALSRLAELSENRTNTGEGALYYAYLSELARRAQKTTLLEMGLEWNGDIIVRESPQGPKVKFRARVTVSGPLGVVVARVLRFTGENREPMVVDSLPRRISPHQQYIREYLIDASELNVARDVADSLRFAIEIRYGGIAFLAHSAAGVRGSRALDVAFEPEFRFIKKVSSVMVDRTIEPFYWKAVVNKPRYFSGVVDVELKTPPGVSAGAIQRTLALSSGEETETIQFPLVAGTSMADGISRLILTLSERGEALATDTALIRVASCNIDDKLAIGFLPDTLGLLEDILRMTDANFTALTDRALEVADLAAYQTIILGSGCLASHPSLLKVRERLTRYIRQGGKLIALGQPENWPPDALPIRIKPYPQRADGGDMQISERNHRVFSKPYEIYTRRLTESVRARIVSTPADIAQGKKLITDRRGRSLLNIINLGEGRIIYCGFPLLERISALEINAIHLFANVVSY